MADLVVVDEDHIKLFRHWIEQGWKVRRRQNAHMANHLSEYKVRVNYEVQMIQEKGFVDYFLIVSDLIRWAKRNEIGVGPGRGSSAGSLVCYLLQITEMDPMQFPMLFERFLDPSRTDEPDIDIDFEDERRDEVFEYAAKKYGREHVANIATFTRYLGKNSLDDIARVYHVPKWQIDSVKSKLLVRAEGHPRFSKSIVDTQDSFADVQETFRLRPELNYAKELESNLRGFGVHAAGMVISDPTTPLTDIVATYERMIGDRLGQAIPYDKRDAVYLGLLKIDALSLITMGEIASICRDAGIKLHDLYQVPLDDSETLQVFRDGDILGIFQFEGVTTRRILKAVQPTTFMHLADVNALARPGANDKGYIANKNSGVMPTFAHSIIENHTTKWPNTYGVITYEEQILMILRDLGGFAPAELNRMRKIIHDKLGSTEFNVHYARFIKGAAAHGLSEDTAKSVWDGMVNASGYAFCVTGDTTVERSGRGGNNPNESPKITVAELYSRQESKTPIGKKIRQGRLSLLSMDDDGRIRPNKLLRIQAPVKVECFTVTTESGRSITISKDHRLLTDQGYKLTSDLSVGDQVIVDLGWAARESERIQNITKLRTEPFKKHGVTMQGTDNPAWIDGRKGMLESAFEEVWVRDEAKCCHCKKEWDGTSHGIEFAHITTLEVCNGDYSKYHNPNNIMLLCNSCHKKFDYRIQGSRNKRWGVGRPTGKDVVVSIKPVGLQDVYDIFMEGPSHNYIGNEFVNHNNIAHSVSYSAISYWQAYLKTHYTPSFYKTKLQKCTDNVRRGKFIAEASRHGITVSPPKLKTSGHDWVLYGNEIVAGLQSIEGIGPKTAQAIIDWRNEKLGTPSQLKYDVLDVEVVETDEVPGKDLARQRVSELPYDFEDDELSWDDVIEVKGVGKKTIEKIKEFVEADDPFGVFKTQRELEKVRAAIKSGQLSGIPMPTHFSIDVPPDRQLVCYTGIVRSRKYYDAVEQLQKRTTGELSYEDALKELDDNHLLKYAALDVEDEYGEIVKVRISRWKYPQYRQMVTDMKMNATIIVVQGFSSDFGGISIQSKELFLVNL